jgi:hypothetical protein
MGGSCVQRSDGDADDRNRGVELEEERNVGVDLGTSTEGED